MRLRTVMFALALLFAPVLANAGNPREPEWMDVSGPGDRSRRAGGRRKRHPWVGRGHCLKINKSPPVLTRFPRPSGTPFWGRFGRVCVVAKGHFKKNRLRRGPPTMVAGAPRSQPVRACGAKRNPCKGRSDSASQCSLASSLLWPVGPHVYLARGAG